MPGPAPRPSVTATGWRSVALAGVAGVAVGWLAFAIPDRFGIPLPPLPLVVTVTIIVLAAGCWVLAWRTHRRVQVRREIVDPRTAVALLAFAKASLLGGAFLVGGYLAVGLYSLPRWSATLPRERVISSAVAVLASIALAAAGAVLERACRIPTPGGPGATPNGLPGSPPSGD